MITMSSAMRPESVVAIARSPGQSSSRIIAALCLAFLCAALATGCSALRIAYGTAPDLVYWWADGYIDFNDEQTPRAREAIAQWFAWNRKTQLPDYAALLTRASTEVLADTTPAKVRAWQDELVPRLRLAFDRIAPPTADLMLTVTEPQVKHLERRYEKYNDEFRDDYLQPDPAKRARATLKRTVDNAEQLYGSLSDAQVALVTEMLGRSPFDPDVWFAERQRRQQAVVQMLRRLREQNATHDQALAALRAYTDSLERSPRPDYRRYADALAEFNWAFAARLHNSTSPAQRRRAADKLSGWADDLRAIAAAREPRPRSLEMQ